VNVDAAAEATTPTQPPPVVILAAGLGSRLGDASAGLPKALAPVLGKPLLDYTLEALATVGVREAYVVLGHRGAEVRAAIERRPEDGLALHMLLNPQFHLRNASSLAVAREAVAGRPFLLLMADHLLSVEAIRRMLAAQHDFAIGVDRGPLPRSRLVDATRVRLGAGGLVTAFGKRLRRWDAIDAGIFRCRSEVFAAIDTLGVDTEISAVMTRVAATHPFHAVDLTGAFWLDVDTPADLAEAEVLLRHG
jgi:choline kinase